MSMIDVPADRIITTSDLAAARAGYKWSPSAIDHANRFAATLRNPMDASQIYRPLTWQSRLLLEPLFGWRRPDGRRRFNRIILFVPKKNGKTSLMSFLGNYMLLADGEQRPGVKAVSTTSDNSEDIYEEAKCMLGEIGPHETQFRTAWLKICEPLDYRKTMRRLIGGGEFECLSSSASNAQGVKGSFVLIDEAHVTLAKHPKLYGSLRYAGSGRKNPIVAIVSTAGDDRQSRPYKIYSDAKKIIAGEIEDLHTLAVVIEAKSQEHYTTDELAAANPGVGEVLDIEQLVDDYNTAIVRPDEWADFQRYRLGIWTKRSTAWLDAAKWAACTDRTITPQSLAGSSAFVGVDLSNVKDLTAACVAVVMVDGRTWYFHHYWLPRDGIEKRCLREIDYLAAEAAGEITLIDGPQIDYSFVAAWIEKLSEWLSIQAVGFDPNRASEIGQYLEKKGFVVVRVKQGWNLSETAQRYAADIDAGLTVHDGNRLTAWCVGNAEVRTGPTGQLMIVKPIEAQKRIDGVIAGNIAKHLLMFTPTGTFFCE